MTGEVPDYEMSGAVGYHYGRFPPATLDFHSLVRPLSKASAALARYDQMLRGMHDSEILLAPLRSQEAVVSSRIEGTISTLDEVLRYEADQGVDGEAGHGYRMEVVEVVLYGRAMHYVQAAMKEGAPLSPWLIRSAHRILRGFGRGANLAPGEYKTEQNYLADRRRKKILFVPISPEQLGPGMDALFAFINDDSWEVLIRTAIAHLEFEALHPFKDGNGRIGRMIIPLLLWKAGVLAQPHFYMSQYLEDHKDEYIDRMRMVSATDDWAGWIAYFLNALESQANANLSKAEEIRNLYDSMKDLFRVTLASQWSTTALDFVFTKPVFRNNMFTSRSGIPGPTAHRFTRTLTERGLLTVLEPAAGRRPALYAFEPLLAIVRG